MHRPEVTARSIRPERRRKWSAVVASFLLLVTASAVVDGGRADALVPVSQSQGRFLSASIGGNSIAPIAALTPAQAVNTGGPTVTNVAPLTVSALNGAVVLTGAINLFGGAGSVIQLGAVNQVAVANPDGSSNAAAGAVSNAGAISLGSATSPSNATVNLGLLVGQVPAGATAFSSLGLNVGAVASTATETAAGAQSGTYGIASLDLAGVSPLVSTVGTSVNSSLVPISNLLASVAALQSVTGIPNLAPIIAAATTVTTPSGAFVLNPQTGTIAIDVAKYWH